MSSIPYSSQTVTKPLREVQYNLNGTVWTDQTTNVSYTSSSHQRTGVKRKKPRTGFRSPTGLFVRSEMSNYGSGNYWSWDQAGRLRTVRSGCFANFIGKPPLDLPVNAGPPRWLHEQLVGQVAGADVTIGVTLAEAGKTINMVRDNILRITKSIVLWRRGFKESAFGALGLRRVGAANSKFLELQYGWTPLIHDVQSQVGLLVNGLSQPAFTVSGKHQSKEVDFITYQTYQRWRRSLQVEGYLRYDFRVKSADALALQRLGLNPLEVAWELVPFSFVYDWFVPVSSALEELAVRALYDFLGGSYTRRAVLRYDLTGYEVRNSQGRQTASGDVFHRRKEVERLAYSSLPYLLTLPVVPPRLNTSQMVSALSLLLQQIGTGKPKG